MYVFLIDSFNICWSFDFYKGHNERSEKKDRDGGLLRIFWLYVKKNVLDYLVIFMNMQYNMLSSNAFTRSEMPLFFKTLLGGFTYYINIEHVLSWWNLLTLALKWYIRLIESTHYLRLWYN